MCLYMENSKGVGHCVCTLIHCGEQRKSRTLCVYINTLWRTASEYNIMCVCIYGEQQGSRTVCVSIYMETSKGVGHFACIYGVQQSSRTLCLYIWRTARE